MTRLMKRMWPEEEAQSIPEYALLLFLVSLTAVSAMGSLAIKVNHAYSSASAQVQAATRCRSLSGGSAIDGVQTQTSTSPFKDDNSLNRD